MDKYETYGAAGKKMIQEVEALVEICHKVYNKGFVSAYDGNLSVRSSAGTVYITRSAVCKGEVTADDIIETDMSGAIISGKGKISTENKIHLFAYSKRADINAVIHCHPVYATAFAAARDSFPSNIFPEVLLTLGKIPVCRYATPSTSQMTGSLEPYINSSRVFILQNHGAVALGSDIKDAYFKIEKLEHTAKILTAAMLLGGAKPIPDDKILELMNISEEVYGIKINNDSEGDK